VFNSQGAKTGYVTVALDHIHVMEFTDHVIPTEERFTCCPTAAPAITPGCGITAQEHLAPARLFHYRL
jgi:hypothetical protein